MKPLFAILLLSVCVAGRALATDTPPTGDDIRLLPLQDHVFKTRDPGHEQTDSWIFYLIVQTAEPRELRVQHARFELLAQSQVMRTTDYSADGVMPLVVAQPPSTPGRLMNGDVSPVPIYWPLALRVRCSEATASNIDAMRITIQLLDGEKTVERATTIPIETYQQKTELIFPFRGPGIVTNAGITNGGHRNRSGQFAIDAVGLDANYGTNRPDGTKSEDYSGWGRAIVAPAAGIVVRARADRPDQPDPNKSDPAYYAPEFPHGGDPGNHVVIDHGNGEFSMIAHFQANSLLVQVGDTVTQGQPLGKLGSSGDTQTPHVHYQLQNGPTISWSDGLPVRFRNIRAPQLVRGTYFNAR